ncbi:sorbosone dehydrogenase family protein [Tsukamurella soli]|uniref:Sorbosone dehydrogenase family protein n=1 Tax=Tsukamurella soli TaxID=644556 RepID=A0ABP8K7G8_9ACTN
MRLAAVLPRRLAAVLPRRLAAVLPRRLAAGAVGPLAALSVTAVALSGCADFSSSEAAPFSAAPEGAETTTTTPPPPTSALPKPKGPCIDQDPAVIATCLTDPTAVVPTETTEHTYTAQRNGDVYYTTTDEPNQLIVHIPVDTSGDGGLMSIALSPHYDEDHLFYAYISTATDNRVVRVAPGDDPKVILAGIPRGATGNVGSIMFTSNKTLVVATGNTGDPAAAQNPASLAGKVFAIDSPGTITPAHPRILMSGVGSRASLCRDPDGGPLFVAEQGADRDILRAVSLTGDAPSVVWTWPDRPGLQGCAVAGQTIALSETTGPRVEGITLQKDSTTATGAPHTMLGSRYGLIGRLTTGPKGVVEGATRNKGRGKPAPTDDRVVLIPISGAAADSPD